MQYKALHKSDPSLEGDLRRFRSNPTTQADFVRLKSNTTYIPQQDCGRAHLFAQLFNQRYRLLLNYLAHSFQLGRSQPLHVPGRRGMVMHRAFGEMYNLKTIAGLLVRLSSTIANIQSACRPAVRTAVHSGVAANRNRNLAYPR